MKVYIYGTGSGAQKCMESLNSEVKVLGFLDSDANKEGTMFCSRQVSHPTNITNENFDYIILASTFVEEIFDFLVSLSFDSTKILPLYRTGALAERALDKQEVLSQFLTMRTKYIVTQRMGFVGNLALENLYHAECDYARYKTFELVSNEIIENGIEGELAEVGVYKGDFSSVINSRFPDKKMYLFDTFEGFDNRDVIFDTDNNYVDDNLNKEYDFTQTSVELVLNKMKYKEQCIVKQGFFPETAVGLEEKFSFVSLDCDLYQPTYAGLEYFYPRLSKGGYIFLHDYNNKTFFGVRKAVQAFEAKYGKVTKIPLSDQGGTLVIIK